MPQQTNGSMRMKLATHKLKVIVKSSFMVHLKPVKVFVRERLQTALYLLKRKIAETMLRMSWIMQAQKVQYREQTLHLYLHAPINIKRALRAMTPNAALINWATRVS